MTELKCVLLAVCLGCGSGLQAMGQDAAKQAIATQQAPTPELKPLPEAPEPVAGDSLYAPLAVGREPETMKTKVDTWLVTSFGPRAVITPAFSSAIRMAKPNYNYPNDWHQGMQGYGRIYGSAIGTKFAGQTARFAVGALTHEDFRYLRSESPDFGGRLFHAIGFVFVDRSDDGKSRFAMANFAGAAAGGFVPNAWLPDGFNDWQHGAERMGTRFGGFAMQNVLREFSPEIFKAFHAAHLPFPRLPIPEWWTKDVTVARRP